MKLTLPVTTLLAAATSVNAAAVTDLDRRYCLADGQPCDTVKRAAEAFAAVVRKDAASASLTARAEEGEVAWIAGRQLRELAVAIAASHDDPEAFYRALGFSGAGAEAEAEAETAVEKREAAPYCVQAAGQPCWNKRAE
ncbi:hypothetical protein VTH06DRAFT_8211, partial [Thermothelomyces fergusii]